MRYRSHQFRADSYGFHSLLEKNVHGIQSLEESFLRRSRTSPITTHNDKNIAATFLLSHTWITIYRHYIRIRRNQSPLNDLTNPRHLLGQRTFWAPANISRQTACISLYFNDTKTLRHISYDYMQVGTSWEVHWSRPHDLSVNVQDGRRALSLVFIWSSGSSQSSQKMFRRSGQSYGNATQTIANDPDDLDDLDRLDRVEPGMCNR